MSIITRSLTLLDRLLAGFGLSDIPRERLEIIDDGIALPTPWPVTANAVATLAAVGLAASHLHELRGGAPSPVIIRTRHAGLVMASSSYLLIDGQAAKFRDPFTGFYEAAHGRWVFLHGNFPHLRDGVLRLLGVTSVEEVAQAVKTRDAFALEAEGIARGLCIAAVRTRTEWQDENQYRHVCNLPLVDIERLDEADRPMAPLNGQPLSQLRMLDLSRVIAGPICGRTIAEYGADVLLVSGPGRPSITSLVIDTGFGKRATEIDLATPASRAAFEALAAECDVFLDAYRPGSLSARGYSSANLARLRPGLVHIDLDAFSRAGPWAERRGYDSLVQATVGMCWDGKNPPKNLPCQPLDYLSGYLGALAAISGLIRRIEQGGGWSMRLSLARTAHWMWESYDLLGREPNPPQARMSPEEARAAGYLSTYKSAYGDIEALNSPLQAPGSRWPSVPVPLGTHPPQWG